MKKGYCVLENNKSYCSLRYITKIQNILEIQKSIFAFFYFVQDIGHALIHATAHAIRQSYVKCF